MKINSWQYCDPVERDLARYERELEKAEKADIALENECKYIEQTKTIEDLIAFMGDNAYEIDIVCKFVEQMAKKRLDDLAQDAPCDWDNGDDEHAWY